MNNRDKFYLGAMTLEAAELDGVQVVRDPDGVWRYAETWIPVPGARDVTLTERFDPKFVISKDGDIERVVVDGASVRTHPDLLDWCLIEGTPIREGDEILEVFVPYALWEDRERVPNELISPEHEGTVAERELAAAERRFREAERRLDAAAEARAEVLRRYSEEMTRQEAREITGLSVGRIQQLIRTERLEDHERQILEIFQEGPIETIEVLQDRARARSMPSDEDLLHDLVRELESRGLLELEEGVGVGLTHEGTQILFAQISNKGGAEE